MSRKARFDKELILKLYAEGASAGEVASKVGCSKTYVYVLAYESGLTKSATRINTRASKRMELNRDSIMEAYNRGDKFTYIAKAHKVSESSLVRWLRDNGLSNRYRKRIVKSERDRCFNLVSNWPLAEDQQLFTREEVVLRDLAIAAAIQKGE